MANERQSRKWNGSCSFFGKGTHTDEDFLSDCMRMQVCESMRVCSVARGWCGGSMCFNWQDSGPWGWTTCSSIASLAAPGANNNNNNKKEDKKGTRDGDRMRPCGQSYVI